MQQPPDQYSQYPQQQWQQPPFSPQQYPQQQWHQQPPKEPKRQWYKRLLAWCRRHPIITAVAVGALLLIGVIGTVTSPPQTPTDTTAVRSTQVHSTQVVEQPTVKPIAKLKPLTLDQRINQIVQNSGITGKIIKSLYNFDPGSNYELVEDDIGDGNLTNSLTVEEIYSECFTIQKALWTQERSHLSEVDVQVFMNVIDQYGNKANQIVGNCDLMSATEQLFNWPNLDQDSAWKDYDNTFIAPFLQN